MIRTVIDKGSVVIKDAESRDELITFGGAATLKAGCILARDSVSLKMVPFVKGGSTNQNGVPKAILTYAVTAAGAGDVAARVCLRGDVIKERLVINADGDDTNIDAAVIDQLRDYGIVPVSTKQLAGLDN